MTVDPLPGQGRFGSKEARERGITGGIVCPGMALHDPAGGWMGGDVFDSFAKLMNVWTEPFQRSKVIRTSLYGHENLLSPEANSLTLQMPVLPDGVFTLFYKNSPLRAMIQISRFVNPFSKTAELLLACRGRMVRVDQPIPSA
jgi:hypothetical protein